MKKLLLITSLAVATAAALAQGTVNFQTKVPAAGIDAPVTCFGTPLAGAEFIAQLFWGTDANSLTPIASPAPFKTGILAGYVSAGTVAFPAPGGTTVFIQMRVRDSAYVDIEPDGKWVLSNTISVKLTEAPTPPADLVGLQGFDVCIPEPSTTALVLLGAAALLLRFGAPKLLRGQGGGH